MTPNKEIKIRENKRRSIKKVSKLNEDIIGLCNMEIPDNDIEVKGQVPIVYSDAINTRRKRVDKLRKDFVQQQENEEKFEKEQENRDMEVKGTEAMKKMHLSEDLFEDTIKTPDGKWTNKGKEGTHGKFNTKKAADAQRRAMFANGYKGECLKEGYSYDEMIDDFRAVINKWSDYLGDKDQIHEVIDVCCEGMYESLKEANGSKKSTTSLKEKIGIGKCCPTGFDYTDLVKSTKEDLENASSDRQKELVIKRFGWIQDHIEEMMNETDDFDEYWKSHRKEIYEIAKKALDLIPVEYREKQMDESFVPPHKLYKQAFDVAEDLLDFLAQFSEMGDYSFLTEENIAEIGETADMLLEYAEYSDTILDGGDAHESMKKHEKSLQERTRGPKEPKRPEDYSSEDLWYAVYDELSATLGNEGSGEQVDKKVKGSRGERYEHVYPFGDSDIIIYGVKPEDFDFARKVADYYGVKAEEPKEDTNPQSNNYYKYSMIIRIPSDKLYTDDIDKVM